MEKQDIIVTKEEIREFRTKYYLTTNEIIPVLDQGATTIARFLEGKIESVDNVELVRKLIDDESTVKERVRDLYIRGLITRHIYMKFFVRMEEPREIEYIHNDSLKDNIYLLMNKYDISLENMAILLELGKEKLLEILSCKVDKRLDIKELEKKTSGEKEFIKCVIKQREKGSIKRRNATIIINKIKSNNPEILEESKKENDKSENKEIDNKEEINKNLTKSGKPRRTIKRVSNERRKEKNIKMARRAALQELDKEIEGRSNKTNRREALIELLYERYQEGGKMTEEDIDIVKSTIAAHPDLVSNYTLRIVVLGSMKTLGYHEAERNINYLISVVRDPSFREKMLKYKGIVRDIYYKTQILKLQTNGKSDAEIMKVLGLGSRDYYRILQISEERM